MYVWGVNFEREIARRNEQDYLVCRPTNGSGFVSRFADLVGIEQVAPRPRIEVMPYATAKAELLDHDPADPFNTGARARPGAGLDAKVGIGSNLTLDGTVNPDFGQVEVDPAVVNLTDVETFFPEKRPFFIEGANIFNFGSGARTTSGASTGVTPPFSTPGASGARPRESCRPRTFPQSRRARTSWARRS